MGISQKCLTQGESVLEAVYPFSYVKYKPSGCGLFVKDVFRCPWIVVNDLTCSTKKKDHEKKFD
jgi:hypothetical protein